MPNARAQIARSPAFLAVFLLALLVLGLYARTVAFEFVRLDDHDYTFLCPFVKNGFSWANLVTAFTDLRHAAIWMPLTYLSYMLDISLFGPGMGPHHLVNAVLHAANAVLFGVLLLRLFAPCAASARSRLVWMLLATLFWALHPLRVEGVAWIAARKEVLCGLFTLLGLQAWLGGRIAWGWAACLCACLAKPTAMCFPFLAGALAFLAGLLGHPRRVRAWAYAPLVLMAAATGAVAVYSQTHAAGYDVRTLYTASFGLRLANAVTSVGLYLWQTCVPLSLHVDVPFPARGLAWGDVLRAAGGYALAGALGWWAVRVLRRAGYAGGRLAGVCAFFFLAAVAPVLGLFGSFGREARADRFTYLPALAVSIVLFAALLAAPGTRRRLVCAALALAGYAGLACVQVGTWRNDYTLFAHVLACDATHARALSHVASEECARFHDFEKGIEHFRASLSRVWNEGTAGQLAFALATRGRHADAAEIRRVCRSAAADPRSDRKGLMLEALGQAALWERKWNEAARHFAWAVRAPARLHPADDAEARLAVALANGGRTEEAERLLARLARPGAVRESVRAFAERALIQLSGGGRVLLFY